MSASTLISTQAFEQIPEQTWMMAHCDEDNSQIRRCSGIGALPYNFHIDGIPLGLPQRELALRFQLQGVVRPMLHMLRLNNVAALQTYLLPCRLAHLRTQ